MIIIVIFIAIWLSNHLTSKFKNLTIGSLEFGKGNLAYRIHVSSRDEIGNLECAFNLMAENLEKIKTQHDQALLKLTYKKQELQDSSSFLNALLNHSPDAIMVYFPSGTLHSFNVTCETMLGYTQDELKKITIADYSGSKHCQKEALDNIRQAEKKGAVDFEWVLKSKSGKLIPTSIRLRKIEIKGDKFVLAFVTNISKRRNAEIELFNTNRQLKDIIEFLPDATFVIDKEKKIIAWNKALENMTNIHKSEILGKGNYEYSIPFYGERRPILIDLIDNEHPETLVKYKNVIQKENYLMGEVYVPTLYGGKGATVWVTASPLIDKDGNTYGTIESVRDISQRKRIEDSLKLSEEKYRTIFDQGVLGIFQSTMEGKLIAINPAFAKMLGYPTPYEALNSIQNISKEIYLNPNRRELIMDELLKFGEINSYTEEFKNQLGSSWIGNLNVRLVRSSHGNPAYLEGFVEDVTQYKEYEEQLIQAKAKAEENNLLKSAFIANMSHEIRTPLNGILGFSQLLYQDNLDLDEKNEFIEIINQNGQQLLNIVNNILDFSKIETDLLNIIKSNVSLKEIVLELQTEFHEQIQKAGKSHIQFITSIEKNVYDINLQTDSLRLKQILSEILENAIKFTEQGSIEFGCVKMNEFTIQFYIKDTGIGIAKDKHELIFESFRQLEESSTRKFGGTGLGLAMIQKLAQLLNGKIWLESELNQGTVFYISIPFQSEIVQDNT